MIYCYQCPNCLEIVEDVRPVARRNARGPDCPAGCGPTERHIGLERTSRWGQDWAREVLSERMGVNPDQVPEHRRRFPNIPMTDTGEIIVRNAAEERRINRELKRAFSED
jgi:hypothetical protein